ncbi:MAG TPA: DUF5681 domain-containing protein [Methylomirabilota bacterium]|nr:DUF5681 domain-containing protein [Methylomirabilota bacterium]
MTDESIGEPAPQAQPHPAPERQRPPARVGIRKVAPLADQAAPPPLAAAEAPASPPADPPIASQPAKGDYQIGYGKPPKAHQFQKGKSGNPKGRPKGARSNATIVGELLDVKSTIKVEGRQRKMSHREIAYLAQVQKAVRGDLKALQALERHDPMAKVAEVEPQEAARDLTAAEQAMLLAYLKATQTEEAP